MKLNDVKKVKKIRIFPGNCNMNWFHDFLFELPWATGQREASVPDL